MLVDGIKKQKEFFIFLIKKIEFNINYFTSSIQMGDRKDLLNTPASYSIPFSINIVAPQEESAHI
ncbi:hypothetical protein NCCP28_16840 [Niallia sp. NCCP-28]|nr:hypothetical protein NCCP28_16840 [Niallia sp. NCCP-28]